MSKALLGATLVAVIAGCTPPTLAPPAAPSPIAEPLALSLLHTADTWGYVLPCG